MLTELITPEMIQLSDQPLAWEEAIRLTAQPLLTHEKIQRAIHRRYDQQGEAVWTIYSYRERYCPPHARQKMA